MFFFVKLLIFNIYTVTAKNIFFLHLIVKKNLFWVPSSLKTLFTNNFMYFLYYLLTNLLTLTQYLLIKRFR